MSITKIMIINYGGAYYDYANCVDTYIAKINQFNTINIEYKSMIKVKILEGYILKLAFSHDKALPSILQDALDCSLK